MYQMSKANNSKNWIKGHVKDPFVIQAQKDGYRSRAAYKLIEIDKNRIASKTETGRVIEEKGPSTESVYERTMRENDEKRFIRVFEPRVIFSIYSEFSSMIER